MTTKDFALAVNKFFYFAMNYRCVEVTYDTFGGQKTEYLPEFFSGENIFHCNPSHMVEKWHDACVRQYDENGCPVSFNDSYSVMNRFYSNLDGQNRFALLKWVCNNYELAEGWGISLPNED